MNLLIVWNIQISLLILFLNSLMINKMVNILRLNIMVFILICAKKRFKNVVMKSL